MEAKIAKPGEVLTAIQYLVVKFKIGIITMNLNWKIEKKS